jgi:hypothetical protein
MCSLLFLLLALVMAGAVAAEDAGTAPDALPPGTVAMSAIAGRGPIADEAAFAEARPAEIALLPQQIATPHAASPSVTQVTVRAVRNADHAAFLLEWSDASKDVRAAIDGFGDMAAIAFPATAPDEPLPSPFMGHPGGPVQILQWRADWQTDLERGPPTVREFYPYAYEADFYHEDHLPPAEAAAFRAAAGAGNPMSQAQTSSVQDLVAEGFGSLTPQPTQKAHGSASHDGSGWRVVITRPLAGGEGSAASLAPGSSTQLAVAIWDGSAGEVGARKSWAGWVPLEVAE